MNIKRAVALISVILILLATAATETVQAQSTYSNLVMSLNPVAYWPLQETTQPPGYDIETNLGSFGSIANAYYSSAGVLRGQDGAVAGDPSVHMNLGNFAIVPTTDHRVSLPAGGPFTVECWVRADVGQAYRGILSQTGPAQNGINGSTNGSGWELSIDYVPYRFTAAPNNPHVFSFHVFNGVGQTGGAEADTADTNWLNGSLIGYTNSWVYLCGVFDGTNCWLYEYSTNLDNANYGGTNMMSLQFPITTAPGAPVGGPPDTSITNGQFSPDTWDPIQIGEERGFDVNYWMGNIDEVAIYTNALTSAQVLSHFEAGTNSAANYEATVLADNPAIYWRMDAPTWTPVLNGLPVAANYGSGVSSMTNLNTGGSGADASVYQPGTIPGVPGPSYPAFGPFTNACAFNGLAGAVDAGYSPLLDPTTTNADNNFTLVGWFKGNPMDSSRWQVLASHSDKSWKAQFNTGTAYGSAPGPLASIAPTRYNVNDGQWHMFALESAASTNAGTNLTVYLDGSVSASVANPSPLLGNTIDAWIGGAPDAGYAQPTNEASYNKNQQYFAGEICHVAYFTNALTPAQLNDLYSTVQPGLFIGTQPVSGIADAGSTFAFTVLASGPQLVYQWYKDNVPLANQTNADLIFDPVQAGDASTNYLVVVTNAYGAVTSAPVSLTVYSTPVISQAFPITYTNQITLYGGQIVGGTNYLGSTPTFSIASVLGSKPLTYQWTTNGVPVNGATNTTFTFPNCQLNGPTSFACVVSNSYGEGTNTWLVTYLPAPMAPFPQAVLADNPITYWRLNEPDDQQYDGNNGAICNDYQSGNNGIYTNVYLSNFTMGTGYSPTTDPNEQSVEIGIYGNPSFAGGIGTNIDFTRPVGSNGEFTVAVWANGNSTVQGNNSGIVTKGGWGHEQFTLDEGNGGKVRWVVRDPATYHVANSPLNLGSDANWHYLVGVCDQAAGKLYIYVDGNLAGSGTIPVGSGILPSTTPVQIGVRADGNGNNTLQFHGFLNEAAVYGYAMSPGQIVSQYAAVGGTNAPYFFPTAPPATAGAGINTTLTIPATVVGTPPIGYTWTNLTTGATVSAGTTNGSTLDAGLTYPNVPSSWNTNQLELIATNAYGTITALVTLSITNTVNLNPTNIVVLPGPGNGITLSWPPDHTGWQLQSNAVGLTATSAWYNVPNSTTTNQIIITPDATETNVFYRLFYQP